MTDPDGSDCFATSNTTRAQLGLRKMQSTLCEPLTLLRGSYKATTMPRLYTVQLEPGICNLSRGSIGQRSCPISRPPFPHYRPDDREPRWSVYQISTASPIACNARQMHSCLSIKRRSQAVLLSSTWSSRQGNHYCASVGYIRRAAHEALA